MTYPARRQIYRRRAGPLRYWMLAHSYLGVIAGISLLLLDEPMSSLDGRLKADLLKELAALQLQIAVTTVYITHDQAEAATLACRIALMRAGRIEQIIVPDRLKLF
jgi:ABC-type sugar transport system ATPase subunit